MDGQDFSKPRIKLFFKRLRDFFVTTFDNQSLLENSLENDYLETENIALFRKLKIKRINITSVSTIIVFLIIYLSICVVFRPWDIFSQTTTAGGDTGTHHYAVKFLLDNLLPQFRVTGW